MTETEMNNQLVSVGKTFPWHELYVEDVDKGIDFYCEALGFEKTQWDRGADGPYKMLKAHGTGVAGAMSTTIGPGIPPHWAVYIAVDNVDARLAKIESLGGKCVVPPMDIPEVGRMALMHDPQGAHFWIFQDMG
jgi:uncharacterized protein